jgi:putative transposase
LTRECLDIEVGQSLRAEQVGRDAGAAEVLARRAATHLLRHGSEFVSAQMDLWAYANQVQLDFSRRGKPTDNAIIESFNGRFREECLNAHWLESIEDAKEKIDAWRWDYNEHRPHRSLEGLTPREFAEESMHPGAADSPR